MKEFNFAVIAMSENKITAGKVTEYANSLFEAGANDCTVSCSGQKLYISFARESESLEDALHSAVGQVMKVGGACIENIIVEKG